MSDFQTYPGKIPGWGLDLLRAAANRPWWARLLLWFALGEAGRHEFWGLAAAVSWCGWSIWEPECEWRSDKIDRMPLFWKDKRPVTYD